jgi:hypothetical protein
MKPFKRVWLSLIVLPIAIPFLLSACEAQNQKGATTREDLVKLYLQSLQTKDEKLMLQLVPPEYSAEQAVKEKIARLGGHELQNQNIQYREVIKPQIISVTIKGTYDGSKDFTDKIDLKYQTVSGNTGRWFLIVGKGNVPSPTVSPAEPQTR